MSDATVRDARRLGTGSDGDEGFIDWRRIESSEEFRELVGRRHRFIALLSALFFGGFLAYLLLATFAAGFMGTRVGGVPVAWLAAVCQVLMTWAVTWAYLRRADREFSRLEERAVERAEARFARAADAEVHRPAPTEARTTTERSAR